MIEFVIIPVIILLDQAIKWYIRGNFRVGETLPVIQDILHITYVQNQGAAFSMFQNMPIITVLIPVAMVIACIVVTIYFHRKAQHVPAILTALIAAGGMGNLIDRIVLGYVTDMIDFRIFPVFNLADIAVTGGCILLVAWIMLEDKLESHRAMSTEDDTEESNADDSQINEDKSKEEE